MNGLLPARLDASTPEGLGRACIFLAFEPGEDGHVEPPAERLLFAAGANATTKGTFNFTARSQREVMKFWRDWTGGQAQRGRADYEHDMARSGIPGQEVWTSAKFDLEVRDGSLWAVNILWIAPADELIRTGKKDGTSPWFAFDPKTGEILAVYNFGLVCMPATYGQEPLSGAAASLAIQSGPVLAPPDPAAPDAPPAQAAASFLLWRTEGLLSAARALTPLPYLLASGAPAGTETTSMKWYAAYSYKMLIAYSAEVMGLCMEAMSGEESDAGARSTLAGYCQAHAEQIGFYAARLADCAQPGEEEMSAAAARLSFIPDEAQRTTIAKAVVYAERLGFKVGDLVEQACKLTGYEDPVQLKPGLLRLGEELTSLRAQAPVLTAVASLAGAGAPEEQAGKLAAQAQELASLRADVQAHAPVVTKAQALTEKKEPAEVCAALDALAKDRTDLQGEIARRDYDAEFALCKAEHKIIGESEEQWVRQNVSTLAALKSFRASKKPSHLGKNHEEPSAAQVAALSAEEKEQQVLASIELTPQEEAVLAGSSGGMTPAQAAERRKVFIKNKAARLAQAQKAA